MLLATAGGLPLRNLAMTHPSRIVVTGGTGFVGRAVCAKLALNYPQCEIVVPTRRRADSRRATWPTQVRFKEADIHDAATQQDLLTRADVLIHLVAVLHGSAQVFKRVHADLPQSLARACADQSVGRVVHVSALGVAADAPSQYLRSKHAGEQAWLESGLWTTLLRPSVIFGAEDQLTNLFVQIQRFLPVLPLAAADALFQPVWVDDVAAAIVLATAGAPPIVECAGPQVMSLRELVRHAGAMAGCQRPVIGLPDMLARLQAGLMSLLPGPTLMSADNLLSMRVPSVATGKLPGLRELGIDPAGLTRLQAHFAPMRRSR